MSDSTRNNKRKSVGLLVKLKHASVGQFVEEWATNLSEGGMFIRSRTPPAPNTRLRFEVQIAGGQRVLRGTGVVRWSRPEPSGAQPAGMGIEFEELDDSSRLIIQRMLAGRQMPTQDEPLTAPPKVTPLAPVARAPAPAPAPEPRPPPEPPGLRSHAARRAPDKAASAAPTNLPDSLFWPEDSPSAPASEAPVDPSSMGEGLEAEEAPQDDLAIDGETPSDISSISAALASVDFAFDEPAAASEGESVPFDPGHVPAPSKTDVDLDVGELLASTPENAAPSMFEPDDLVPDDTLSADDLLGNAPVAAAPAAQKPAPLAVLREAPPAPPAPPPPPANANNPVFLTSTAPIAGDGLVVGIDLGTSNCCVAVLSNGRPQVIRSKDGYNTIPSVVSLTPRGKLLVSHRAKDQLLLNPARTIYGAKRLVGRPYESPTVRQVRERFHYAVVPGANGRAAVQLGEHVVTLEEVQGIVLRECKELAEQQLGQKVDRAIVTVPAYYSEPQREAVRKAGTLAGLKVERILNEPTSAALAYGLNRQLNRKALVYDLGGGTFDATLLKIDKNVFEVLSTGGDTFLGGVDFDSQIVDYLLEKFREKEGLEFSGDNVALARVNDAAERAKIALSERTTWDVHVPMLMMDDKGKGYDLRYTLTRAELEKLCAGLIDRTLEVVRDVLLDAKVRPSDVQDIILVGGQSRMPIVRERLRAFFGRPAQASVNADEAVALGAALYSGSLSKVSSVVLVDVLPMTIGVGLPGGEFRRILERNTPLPAQRSFAVIPGPKDTALELTLFQGEDAHVSANEYLGTVRLDNLPKGQDRKVAVTLKLDAECVLHIDARELSTRAEVRATIATRYTPEELSQQLKMNQDAIKRAQSRREEDLKARGGRFWSLLKKVIGRA